MAETFGSLIDYIANQLQGFVTDAPMYATTSSALDADDLTVTLDLPSQSQPQGLVEIDGELIHITQFDPSSNTATIPPWGRGQQGTSPAPHALGAKVTVAPKYPRNRVGQVINQVVAAICPPLHGVQIGEVTLSSLTYEYALPVTTRNLLRTELKPVAGSAYDWRPLRSATMKRDSGAPMLHVTDPSPGAVVRYVVATNPTALIAESDLFTATGLPESCIDLISMGAIPRLISTSDLARQQLNSVEVSERSAIVPSGSGAAAARFYMQMFQDRLAAEVRRQRQEYPLTVRRTA